MQTEQELFASYNGQEARLIEMIEKLEKENAEIELDSRTVIENTLSLKEATSKMLTDGS